MRKKFIFLMPCLTAILISGCGGKTQEGASGELFAMDTYMSITCYGDRGEEALQASVQEIERLDSLLSTGDSESEISRINENGGGTLSPDTETILNEALEIYEMTDGAFDITLYPVSTLWGFTDKNFRVPSDEEIADTLAYCGAERLTADGSTLTLGENQKIDFGGIAKGYTSDRIKEIFREYGIESGVISLGGNVLCFGTKPDGSLWRCGIMDPENPDQSDACLGVVSVSDRSVITAGAYERNFTDKETGKTYHHIIDPSTGYPAESGLISVSVVSENGMLADGLSTACYVMGLEGAEKLWRAHADEFELVLMDETDTVYVTEGLQDSFSSSSYQVKIIEREE